MKTKLERKIRTLTQSQLTSAGKAHAIFRTKMTQSRVVTGLVMPPAVSLVLTETPMSIRGADPLLPLPPAAADAAAKACANVLGSLHHHTTTNHHHHHPRAIRSRAEATSAHHSRVGANNRVGGYARSDAELEQIMDGLHEQEVSKSYIYMTFSQINYPIVIELTMSVFPPEKRTNKRSVNQKSKPLKITLKSFLKTFL